MLESVSGLRFVPLVCLSPAESVTLPSSFRISVDSRCGRCSALFFSRDTLAVVPLLFTGFRISLSLLHTLICWDFE